MKFFRKLFNLLGIYDSVKYSRLFKVYESLFKPHVKKQFLREVKFYSSFLKPCSLIFDIGANDGHKTEAFLKLAKKIILLEPDEKNYAVLRKRFKRNQRVQIEHAAVGNTNTFQDFYIHHPGSSFNTLSTKFKSLLEKEAEEKFKEKVSYETRKAVIVTTLDSLIEKYGLPYFIKIDTEGYELEILKGLSQPVQFISLEFFFPAFKDEFFQSLELLRRKFGEYLTYNIAINEILIIDFVTEEKLLEYLADKEELIFELIVRNQVI